MGSWRVDVEIVWSKFSFLLTFFEQLNCIIKVSDFEFLKVCEDKNLFLILFDVDKLVVLLSQQIDYLLIIDFHVWGDYFGGMLLFVDFSKDIIQSQWDDSRALLGTFHGMGFSWTSLAVCHNAT